MADKNQSCFKEFTKAGVKFPCGSFEKMLKAVRDFHGKAADDFDWSAIMKKFCDETDIQNGCSAILERLCSDKEGNIDCKSVMAEIFGGGDKKGEQFK